MKNNVKRRGNWYAAIAVSAVIIFLIAATWILSRPQPFEIQGEAEATQVKVASKLVGRIDSIAVHKGDKVKKGQLLFIIKSPEVEAKLEQANAALMGAEAQNSKAIAGAQTEDIQAAYDTYQKALAASELAEKTYNRIKNLYHDGVVPAQKYDEAETNLKAARETASAAKSQWEKAKNGTRSEDKRTAYSYVARAEAAIKEIESYASETNIYAPCDGEISNILAEVGELVNAGYPVISIVKLEDAWVTFNIREDLLADVRVGDKLSARFPALGDKEFSLKITFINSLGSFATWSATKTSGDFDMKTFEVRAVPETRIEGLRPGMSAIVDWDKVRKN